MIFQVLDLFKVVLITTLWLKVRAGANEEDGELRLTVAMLLVVLLYPSLSRQ